MHSLELQCACLLIAVFAPQRLASYPGLLTPESVACSIEAGEGLVKLSQCNDVPGRVEEWHIPSVQL